MGMQGVSEDPSGTSGVNQSASEDSEGPRDDPRGHRGFKGIPGFYGGVQRRAKEFQGASVVLQEFSRSFRRFHGCSMG